MKTAIAYLRVSTDEQADSGYGLTAQRQSVEDYADHHGYQITAVFIDDISGTVKIAERPAGGKLVKAIQNRSADAVIFPRIDRLSKETRPIDFLGIVQLCDDSQVRLLLADQGEIDLENLWPLIAHCAEQTKAEENRNRFRESTINGRLDKARAGKIVMTGIAPYGYRRESRGPDARLVIDPQEAATIREVYRL